MDGLTLARDFAAPLATIAAACAAAFVTLAIQRQNQQLAQARLKLDLYDKRYEVYAAARDLIHLVQIGADPDDPTTKAELKRIYFRMNEVSFLCSRRAQEFYLAVRDANQSWRSAHALASNIGLLVPGPERVAAAKAPGEAIQRFLNLKEDLVGAF